VFGPPGVPKNRVTALRKAFKATLEDPAFLAETAKAKLAIRYVSGEDLDALVKRIYSAPPSVAHAAQEAIKP
jgi:tripartite-type tricarboxylate transporter receptor subunit TctC